MYLSRLRVSAFFAIVFCIVGSVSFVSANTLQVTPTVTLTESEVPAEGTVVISDDARAQYFFSRVANDAQVFGVTALQPALVFSTGIDQVPVVTQGIALVQITASNGAITRGDLLVTSSSTGVAMRAGASDAHVFAVALEDAPVLLAGEVGVIQAEVGVEHAQAVLAAQRQLEALQEAQDTTPDPVSIVRGIIAIILSIGALFFILYSFRSTIAQGVVSVGRNPRARRSIVVLAFGNIVFALILCAAVVFIAVAILILPL